ncbi:MAG: TraB/GumN family protein [Candidatus Nanohaloarchaeota archaeon QJJ-5]|nr:TraB/GumN family protein [Candidatus Nanohaloarchaeota archaeon QJJ-5]
MMIETVDLEDKTVILVGTAHISQQSVETVNEVIEDHRPDRVCVELDQSRKQSMEDEGWGDRDIKEVLRQGDGHLLLFNIILSIYQRRLADDIDIEPGAEMLAAIDTAEQHEIPVSLIDRDINITLKRTLSSLSWLEKIRLLTTAVEAFFTDEQADIEDIENDDIIYEIIEEFAGSFPHIKQTIIDERDQYMAQRLREADGETIVAVVGAGHVAGIAEELRYNGVISTDALEQTDESRSVRKGVKYAVPAVILGLFAYGLWSEGIGVAGDMLIYWVGFNAFFGGLGAVLSKAHPLTTIVTAIAAPFTSVNPALPAGLVAAYTENRMRPPLADDLASIGDITAIKELWGNSATRLLVLFFLVNLGSSIATFIGFGVILRLLQFI